MRQYQNGRIIGLVFSEGKPVASEVVELRTHY
jgi:hypothetical protein